MSSDFPVFLLDFEDKVTKVSWQNVFKIISLLSTQKNGSEYNFFCKVIKREF